MFLIQRKQNGLTNKPQNGLFCRPPVNPERQFSLTLSKAVHNVSKYVPHVAQDWQILIIFDTLKWHFRGLGKIAPSTPGICLLSRKASILAQMVIRKQISDFK